MRGDERFFRQIVQKICRLADARQGFLVQYDGKRSIPSCASDLISASLEGIQRHVIFHTKVARYEGVGIVSDYVDELIPNGFVQVHHSYIVNMDYIQAIEKDKVILRTGANIWISVRKRTETLKAFDHYLTYRKW